MQRSNAPDSSDYAKAITSLVTAMPVEHAAEVYDFARFLRSRAASLTSRDLEDEDWLNDSEEEMQTEEALWETAFDRRRDTFAALADAARVEIAESTRNMTVSFANRSAQEMSENARITQPRPVQAPAVDSPNSEAS